MTRRVVVNDAIGARGVSGTARVADQLVTALEAVPHVDVERIRPPWSSRHRSPVVNAARDAWWDMRGAGRAARRPDLLVSPCNIGRAPAGVRHLLFVQDVMVLESPEYFDAKFARYFTALMPRSVRHADCVVASSQHTRRMLLELVPGADVRVVDLPGRRDALTTTPWPEHLTVLMVGATEPHKNHVAGVEAVNELRRTLGVDVRLRIVGPAGRAEPALTEVTDRHDPRRAWVIRDVGLSDADVDAAYGSSWLLLQPSLNEGYGLPLVEATQRGLPVVHSGRGAMSEVAAPGDAGGPDPASLVAAMTSLLDRQTWAVRSAAAVAAAPRFGWPAFVARVAELSLELVPPTDLRDVP